MLKEFKEFVARGSAVDLAVGIVIGAAFGAVVKSLVDDIIMPPIGLLLGKVDFANLYVVLKEGSQAGPYASLAGAKAAGAVTLNYGQFINATVTFVIVAFVIFLIVKAVNHLRAEPEPDTKDCPFCLTSVPLAATRCSACTSELPAE